MNRDASLARSAIPSVSRVLEFPAVQQLMDVYGRNLVKQAVRSAQAELREVMKGDAQAAAAALREEAVIERVEQTLKRMNQPSMQRVFNLTGTILHTNLGRACLPQSAVSAMAAASGSCNVEYDLAAGQRGDRDAHLESWLTSLTGAEAATVVNNNAAAVMLVLNTLALGRQVPVSRGELVEIGGSFRMPDIITRAGCHMVEVGTTNRTHASDYEHAIGPQTALLLKVHRSNFEMEGFVSSVPESELAGLARNHDLPLAVDLGSGTLVDLERYGLPHEPTPGEIIAKGADLVTFSGDKLLGGPQAGIIVGRKALIEQLKLNPMKRALRLDKTTIAGLEAVLRLYADPDRLPEHLPTLKFLIRKEGDIRDLAERVKPALEAVLEASASVDVVPCRSQVGSGSFPTQTLPSTALAIRPHPGESGTDKALQRIALALRRLPLPVIGRIRDGVLYLDLRCLEDEAAFQDQLHELEIPGGGPP